MSNEANPYSIMRVPHSNYSYILIVLTALICALASCEENVECDVEQDEFTGAYMIRVMEEDTSIFGPWFGHEQTIVDIVAVTPTVRAFEYIFLDFTPWGVDTLIFDMTCDGIVPELRNVHKACGGDPLVHIGPGPITPFDRMDQKYFEMHLVTWLEDGGCGVEPIGVTIGLVKI